MRILLVALLGLIFSGCSTFVDRNTHCWYDRTFVCEQDGHHCYPVTRQHCLKDEMPYDSRQYRIR